MTKNEMTDWWIEDDLPEPTKQDLDLIEVAELVEMWRR